MSLEKTEAVMLKAMPWAESSQTVIFFSREIGRLALIDKGGRSFKSRRSRVLPFARLEITYYSSSRDIGGYISDVELLQAYTLESGAVLGRLAYASAACELLNILLPDGENQGALYRGFTNYLERMQKAERKSLPVIFLTFFLTTLSHLGFHPSFSLCVGCGKPIEVNSAKSFALSPLRGGVVCNSCQKPGEYYIHLSSEGLKSLIVLQTASLSEAEKIPIGYSKAAVLLEALEKIVTNQVEFKVGLKSLEFLEKLKNSRLQQPEDTDER